MPHVSNSTSQEIFTDDNEGKGTRRYPRELYDSLLQEYKLGDYGEVMLAPDERPRTVRNRLRAAAKRQQLTLRFLRSADHSLYFQVVAPQANTHVQTIADTPLAPLAEAPSDSVGESQPAVAAPLNITDLDFAGNDTLYATHGLHTFAAKCPPPLVRWGIERFSTPGETVLDPMMGSGTTLVEARMLERHAIGIDVDPLACLIAQVKATPLCLTELDRTTQALLATLAAESPSWRQQANGSRIESTSEQTLPSQELPTLDPDIDPKWFLPEVCDHLARLKRHIATVDTSPEIRRYLWVAFSSLILARTSVANARDIVHSRHHYYKHAIPPHVPNIFRRRLTTMRRMMREFMDGCSAEVQTTVQEGDVRELQYPDNSVQLVFTSPPYGTALDYTRAHFLSIGWLHDVLGIAVQAYTLHGRQYIGTERAVRTTFNPRETPIPELEPLHTVLSQLSQTDPEKALALMKYFVDMDRALYHMGRVVQPGRYIVLVVCPSHVRRIQIPTNELLVQIATRLALPGGYALHLEQQIERTLDDRRRVLPYMTEAFGERMRTEYVIVLRKVPR